MEPAGAGSAVPAACARAAIRLPSSPSRLFDSPCTPGPGPRSPASPASPVLRAGYAPSTPRCCNRLQRPPPLAARPHVPATCRARACAAALGCNARRHQRLLLTCRPQAAHATLLPSAATPAAVRGSISGPARCLARRAAAAIGCNARSRQRLQPTRRPHAEHAALPPRLQRPPPSAAPSHVPATSRARRAAAVSCNARRRQRLQLTRRPDAAHAALLPQSAAAPAATSGSN